MIKDTDQIAIGEKILVVSGIAKLGSKPGILDKLLGEKDVRRIVIEGENIDPESAEYQGICANTYRSFKEHCGSEISEKLREIEGRYQSIVSGAEKDDQIKWLKVFADSLLLSNVLATSAMRAVGTNSKAQFSNNSVSDATDFSQIFLQDNVAAGSLFEGDRVVNPRTDSPKISENDSTNYLSTAVKTVGDAVHWLNERSNGVPQGMLMFAVAKMTKLPIATSATLGATSTILSATPQAEAVMVGDKDYATTVYCGPKIKCDYLADAVRDKKIKLVEFDKNQKIGRSNNKAERLIVDAHGLADGSQAISYQSLMQPDDFAVEFFPNAKIIHASGCLIGGNLQENFGQNSLKPNQILFIHSGNESIVLQSSTRSVPFLISESNSEFPVPIPLQILLKEPRPKSSTIFASLTLPTLQDLSSIAAVDEMYDLIASNVNTQKKSALEKFENYPQAIEVIVSELEKLGFKDFSQEMVQDKKREFVTNYLGEYLSHVAGRKEISAADLDSIDVLFQSQLVDVNFVFNNFTNIATLAAGRGHHQLLEILAKNGADFNQAGMESDPLYTAAQNGHDKCLEVLIKNGANGINRLATATDMTPAYIAAQQGHYKCLEILAKNQADLELPCGSDGSTALHTAAQNGHYQCIEILAKNGVNLNRPKINGLTAAHIAAHMGHDSCLQVLAENGADLNQKSDNQQLPIGFAIELGHDKCLEVFAKNGVDLNQKISDGSAAIHFVAQRCFDKCLEVLIKNGADLNQKNEDGVTAAHFAAYGGHDKCLKILAENKADLEVVYSDGTLPVHFAAQNGHDKSLRILAKNGVNLNYAQSDGTTAAHLAASGGYDKCLQVLEEYEADLHKIDSEGKTPADHAKKEGYSKCVKILKENKAKIDNQTMKIKLSGGPESCSQLSEAGQCEASSSVSPKVVKNLKSESQKEKQR